MGGNAMMDPDMMQLRINQLERQLDIAEKERDRYITALRDIICVTESHTTLSQIKTVASTAVWGGE